MFEFIFALSWLGWCIFGILSLLIIALVANDLWGWTTFSVLIFLVALWYFVPAILLVLQNPMQLLWYAIIYVAIGVVYSFIKWCFVVLHCKETKSRLPEAKNYKAEIIGWMVYWPWSAIWTLLNDPVRRFYNMLAKLLEGIYDKVAEAIYM